MLALRPSPPASAMLLAWARRLCVRETPVAGAGVSSTVVADGGDIIASDASDDSECEGA